MRLLPCVVALATLPVVASAGPEDGPLTIDHWTIEPVFGSCFATNRPDAELNAAPPIHTLAFAMDAEGAAEVIVAFWPGAIPAEATGSVTIAGAEQDTTLTVAPVESDDVLKGELTDAARAALLAPDERGVIAVRSPGGAEVWFDVSALPAVLTALAACAEGLGE